MNLSFFFFYGTLKKKFQQPNGNLLGCEAEWVCEGYATGFLYSLSWYPGAVFKKNINKKLHGDIFRIRKSWPLVDRLDQYEGIERRMLNKPEYKKKKIIINTYKLQRIKCTTYEYNQPPFGKKIFQSGVF